ncbi:hypothetical protein MAA5396_04720 [Marinovum algicola]|uniref:O-antigen polysaccharide polymerase Wzy n=1 Tax=Marinovum algicola TaxID=42444 RepID=A0A975WFH5_9RHOB|nr:hypothetical protein [Marinovum algicola]SEK11249.1 hypothetical protein SAMN04487940_1372 [Marinovum algicola]SLN76436.1 hypothetical protein MAA5396_04720 [Marinovum algicola]
MTALLLTMAAINLLTALSSETRLPTAHLVAAVLAVYLAVEAHLLLRRADALSLLSPAFLALLFHFALSYLAGPTMAAFEPTVMTRFAFWLPDFDAALTDTLILAMIAAFCMLRSYALARPFARGLRRSLKRMPALRREIRPNVTVALAMQVGYLALVAYAIDLGVYGLLSRPEALERHLDAVALFNLGLAAGSLSYFLLLLHYFGRRGRASSVETAAIVALIALHVALGLLAAFKSQAVFPFVIAGFAYFLTHRRLPVGFLAMALLALVVAYAVVEPFRGYLALRGEPPGSVVEAVETLETAFRLREQVTQQHDNTVAERVAERVDLSGMSMLALDYVDRGNLQDHRRREFQNSILLAPILAYIPRAVWPNKPSFQDVGRWFNQRVRGHWWDETTSVGMGPIGYLYVTGGILGVILGFALFGGLQALIFEGFGRAGAGGLIVYLSVAANLVMIPSAFGPVVTGVLRMLPIAFVAQMLLIRPAPRR